ncbi:MAG: pilus assembly protein PilM [Myxococcaceae bacterium]|nr:pilus assembly protein PilM [Myxococcaceae bacterium]
MARVLGLDLGSHSVKAVLFETTMRGHQTRTVTAVLRAQEGDRSETLRAALTELFSRGGLSADQIVISLPGQTLATHSIVLPFLETKKLEQALPFELESQLPFDLSEVVYDYQVAAVREKKSELLVGVVRKEELSTLLSVLDALKIDPRIVTHPAIAYQNLLPHLGLAADPPDPIAVVDIGHERTCVCIAPPHGPVEFARTFSGGGRDLTRALMNGLQLSFPEAERWKEEQGAVASAVTTADQRRAESALVRGLQPVIRELRQSFKAYAARSRKQVSRVLLCGGTARLAGIVEQLTRDLGIPCALAALPGELTAKVPVDEQPTVAQAYALALRGMAAGSKAPRFNFRRGEFAFKGGFDFARGKMGRLAAFAATLLILAVASGIVQNTLLARREAQIEDRICEITEAVLKKCERDFTVAKAALQGAESPAAQVPKLSAVTLLAEVTQRIPPSSKVQIENIEVGLERISLRASTESTKSVDEVTEALKKYECFSEVQQRKVERSRDGSKVNFGLDIQVQCPNGQEETPQG